MNHTEVNSKNGIYGVNTPIQEDMNHSDRCTAASNLEDDLLTDILSKVSQDILHVLNDRFPDFRKNVENISLSIGNQYICVNLKGDIVLKK